MAISIPLKHQCQQQLLSRLHLAKIPFERQGDKLSTANAKLEFRSTELILHKTGKASRYLPYPKVRLSQLLLHL